VPDFTSSHYLGLRHPSSALAGWAALTTGRPAALDRRTNGEIALRLANLLGTSKAVLARSTVHANWDLGAVIGGEGTAVLVDAGAYPTSSIAALIALGLGSPVLRFAHHEPDALGLAIRASRRRPVVLVDGWCPGCGGPPPIAAYERVVADRSGLLVVDETQTVGLLPSSGRHHTVVASLAKAFGAPLAVIAGGRHVTDAIHERGPSRTASSPPTAADLAATSAALDADELSGNARRARLWNLVHRFRSGLSREGVPVVGDPFPVQPVGPFPTATALRLSVGLRCRGVRAVTQRLRCRANAAAVTFVLTAAHRPSDVDAAIAALTATIRGERHGSSV
jgi:8-amino-7-oxononanoate synthase